MLKISPSALNRFVAESNRIENITRSPRKYEIASHEFIIDIIALTPSVMQHFVTETSGAPLRTKPDMNVRVGNHVAPRGGDQIMEALDFLTCEAHRFDPWTLHNLYMWLHPFMDGNGRSGRALWLRQMTLTKRTPEVEEYGFLRAYYYQTLSANDGDVGDLWSELGWNFV